MTGKTGGGGGAYRKGACQMWCVEGCLAPCLSPDTSCHPPPGRGCDDKANRPSALWPRVDQMADRRPPRTLTPTVWCAPGDGGDPTVPPLTAPASGRPPACLSPAWGRERSPRSKVLSLVPGTTPVSGSSETERSHLVICHQAPANRKTQIVSSLQTICK